MGWPLKRAEAEDGPIKCDKAMENWAVGGDVMGYRVKLGHHLVEVMHCYSMGPEIRIYVRVLGAFIN